MHPDLDSAEVKGEGEKAIGLWRDIMDKETVSLTETAVSALKFTNAVEGRSDCHESLAQRAEAAVVINM